MAQRLQNGKGLIMLAVGLMAWFVPGGGYLLLKEKKRAIIIFVTITSIFVLGIYVGSIGVIDPVNQKMWYTTQVMYSPVVTILGSLTISKGYNVFGRPYEIGQIYTSIAGMLNLLCIINSVHLAYSGKAQETGG